MHYFCLLPPFDMFNRDVHQTILLLTTLVKRLRINDCLALAASSQWIMSVHVWMFVCVYHLSVKEAGGSPFEASTICAINSMFESHFLLQLIAAAMTYSFHIVYTNLPMIPLLLWHIECRHKITNHWRYIFNTTLQQHGFLKSFQVDISVHMPWLCSIRLFITRKLLLSCHS